MCGNNDDLNSHDIGTISGKQYRRVMVDDVDDCPCKPCPRCRCMSVCPHPCAQPVIDWSYDPHCNSVTIYTTMTIPDYTK